MSYFAPQAVVDQSYAREQTVARAFAFDTGDLIENSKGNIRPQQAERLRKQAAAPLRPLSAALLTALAMLALLALFSIDPSALTSRPDLDEIAPPLYMPAAILTVLLVAAGLAAEFVFRIIALRNLSKDLAEGEVARTAGAAHFSRERVLGPTLTPQYWLVVKNKYFPVTQEAEGLVPPGAPCVLYHTPRSGFILSMEVGRGLGHNEGHDLEVERGQGIDGGRAQEAKNGPSLDVDDPLAAGEREPSLLDTAR